MLERRVRGFGIALYSAFRLRCAAPTQIAAAQDKAGETSARHHDLHSERDPCRRCTARHTCQGMDWQAPLPPLLLPVAFLPSLVLAHAADQNRWHPPALLLQGSSNQEQSLTEQRTPAEMARSEKGRACREDAAGPAIQDRLATPLMGVFHGRAQQTCPSHSKTPANRT